MMDTDMTNRVNESSLLELVRPEFYRWPNDPEQSIQLLIKRQSEFPLKIREFIDQAQEELEAGETPFHIVRRLYEATVLFFFCRRQQHAEESSIEWYGPDIAVDTEEEIEVAIRFFPHILQEFRMKWGVWGSRAIHAATTSLKSLPFVPLLAELGHEYHFFDQDKRGGLLDSYVGWKTTPLYQIMTNNIILEKNKTHSEKFYQQIDTVSLSVLVRLKEKGLVTKNDIWECVKILITEISSRTEQRLRFFLHWDPTFLKTQDNERVESFYSVFCTSLLEYCLWQCSQHKCNVEGMLERFQTLLDLGLVYYAEEIGFLFHRDDLWDLRPKPAFPVACKIFGQETVIRVVNESLSKHMRGSSNEFHKLVFLAATKEEILLDGLYLLIRREPAALISSLSKSRRSTTTEH